MNINKFKAIVLDGNESINNNFKNIGINQLSSGDVLIKNSYSTLNYKDMLAFQKENKIIHKYPMIPGVDLSGEVVQSENSEFKPGDKVIATGYGIGVSHTGGLAEYARLPHEWITPLPNNLSLKQAMIIGTAGLAAGLSIDELEKHGMTASDQPQIIVTGATGGVGSIAMLILKKLGYKNVTAVVRKEYQVDIAEKLGAAETVYAEDLTDTKLLQKQQFNFVIDTVGGQLTANLLPKIHYNGCLALCGNAGGNLINTNVFPFILRKIDLLGIDTVNISHQLRKHIWEKFANKWNISNDVLFNEITLDDVLSEINKLKQGKHLGRTIVKL